MLVILIPHTTQMEINLLEIRRKVLKISWAKRGVWVILCFLIFLMLHFFSLCHDPYDYIHSFILQGEVGECNKLVKSWIAPSWYCLPGKKNPTASLCEFLSQKDTYDNPGECSLLVTKELKMQWMSFHITYVAQIFHQYIMRKWARASVPLHFSFEIFNYCNYFNKFLLMDSSSLHADTVHTFISLMCFKTDIFKKSNNLPFSRWGHLWQWEIKGTNFMLCPAVDPVLSQHSGGEQFEGVFSSHKYQRLMGLRWGL